MGIKISDLPSATVPLTGSELVPVVQGGVTSKAQIFDLLSGSTGAASVGYLSSFTGSMATTVSSFLNRITSLENGSSSHSDGTDTIVGSPRWFIGNNSPSSDDSALLLGRGLSGSYSTGAHGVRDETTYTSPSGTGLIAYASFDSIPTIGGTTPWNHARSFQARILYTGSGLLDEEAGLQHQITHNGSGTITWSYAVRASNALGTGTITNQAALFVDATFNRGSSSNYAIYSGSTSVTSYHGGMFQFGTAPKISAAGFTTYGAILAHDTTGNLLSNPNLNIINGVLTMANATTSKITSSVAANLQLDAVVAVQSNKPHQFPVYTVATLPSPASAYTYCRAFVSDANATMTAGIGAVVAGGGANKVPVYCDGTNWRIG